MRFEPANDDYAGLGGRLAGWPIYLQILIILFLPGYQSFYDSFNFLRLPGWENNVPDKPHLFIEHKHNPRIFQKIEYHPVPSADAREMDACTTNAPQGDIIQIAGFNQINRHRPGEYTKFKSDMRWRDAGHKRPVIKHVEQEKTEQEQEQDRQEPRPAARRAPGKQQ